tara:strand:+ start:677 stop:907 length:231 start_codon:yes stop_codon:yes gene_type:complete
LGSIDYPGEVEIGTVVTRIGNSSFNLGQGVFREDKCVATADVVSVYLSSATGKSQNLPDPLREVLEKSLPNSSTKL